MNSRQSPVCSWAVNSHGKSHRETHAHTHTRKHSFTLFFGRFLFSIHRFGFWVKLSFTPSFLFSPIPVWICLCLSLTHTHTVSCLCVGVTDQAYSHKPALFVCFSRIGLDSCVDFGDIRWHFIGMKSFLLIVRVCACVYCCSSPLEHLNKWPKLHQYLLLSFLKKVSLCFQSYKNGKQSEDPVKHAGIMLQTCNMTAVKNESLRRGVLVLKKPLRTSWVWRHKMTLSATSNDAEVLTMRGRTKSSLMISHSLRSISCSCTPTHLTVTMLFPPFQKPSSDSLSTPSLNAFLTPEDRKTYEESRRWLEFSTKRRLRFQEVVCHSGKRTYSLSFQQLNEKIDRTLPLNMKPVQGDS